MKERFLETSYAAYWIQDGIVWEVFKLNLIINTEIAKDIVKKRLEVSNGISRPILLDIKGLLSVDTASRKYLAGKEAAYLISAGAILVNGNISRFAGNIFLTIDRPVIPTKLFTDQEKAIKWLQKFKK